MDARDTAILRDHLVSIKTWIEHWKVDADHNLACTPDSLAMAHYRAKEALKVLDDRRAAV